MSVLFAVGWVCQAGAASVDLPENLAASAKITADSEYNGDYRAQLVADSSIPSAEGHADAGLAWAVNGETHRDGATITFTWDHRVPVAEIVYFGRTGWFLNECWKDYEVYANVLTKPIASGRFDMVHGPQRIRLRKPVNVRRLIVRFTSSYGGLNPGASEILILGSRSSEKALDRFLGRASSGLATMPFVDTVDCDALRSVIHDLSIRHGGQYPQAAEHLDRLAGLQRRRNTDETAEALAALQRDVLLFDVDKLVVIRRHEIEASHVYTYHYEGFKPGGGLYAVDPHRPGAPALELASSPEGQILDCDLSYDGKTVLFSLREREDEGYHLWTVNVDGTGLTRLTGGEWHDYNGCWLPDGGIAFLSTRTVQFAYCWHAPVGILHRMAADGSGVQRLSGNYLNDFTPAVLNDGRIIYSRWEYVDKPAIPIQSLWTVNPDGTALSVYFGNGVLSPGTFMEARPVPGTNAIICTMTGHNGPTRGAIGIIDRSQGINAQAAIRNLTPDVPVPGVNEGNGNTPGTKQYGCPFPLDGTRFLVSARGPVLARTIDGTCQSIALDMPDDGMQYFCAQPVRPKHQPPAVPSTLIAETPDVAFVYLQDVYQGLEPRVKRGDVVRLRVVREMQKAVRIDPSLRAFGFQFPVISCGATYAAKDVLGDVPVESDGSAYFRVPAGVPIYFLALDSAGRAVQRMRSFTHLMPGETQGCVGCHEPRHGAPPARQQHAANRPFRDLEPPEWGQGGFDYARVVQPVLDQYCIECHDSVTPPQGVDLTGGTTDFFNVSYDVLARENQGPKGSPYVNWIPTYNGQEQNILETRPKAWGSHQSMLADLVWTGHPDPEGKPRVEMDDTSRRRIFAWIDLNVPYYASSETAYPERTGCRQLAPAELDAALKDVAQRRCTPCHSDGNVPRRVWTRVTEPELNPFLVAPLARSAGGSERCGKAVFLTKDDPDYRTILDTFNPVGTLLAQRPRMDMPGGQPAPDVCRDRK